MEGRVIRAAHEAGVPASDLLLLERALRAATRPREFGAVAMPSDHPAFLHPARTVLILLDDLAERDGWMMSVGALAESRDLQLRVPDETVRELFLGSRPPGSEAGPGITTAGRALAWWEALPVPDWRGSGTPRDDDLVELLVSAPEAVLRLVLVEALDQLRHAHLWESRAERIRARELTERVFEPLAPRAHPVLDRRFAWWLRRIGRGDNRFA